MRKLSNNQSLHLKDVVSPEYFQRCIAAVKTMAGYDDKTRTYLTPSLALKICHALKKIAKVPKRQMIESRQYSKIVDIDHFHDLCADNWGDEVAACALDTLRHQKRNKVNLLPITEDVQKLMTYLRNTATKATSELQAATATESKEGVSSLYRDLAEVTLVDIITFNRRRQGEASKMTVDDFRQQN